MDPLLDMVHVLLCEDADEAVEQAERADQELGTAAAAYAFAVRHAAFTVVCSLITLFPERLSSTVLAPLRVFLPPVLRKALVEHVEQESAARVPQLLREGVAEGGDEEAQAAAGAGEGGAAAAAAVGTLLRPSRDLATAVGPAGLAPGFDDAYDMRTPSRVLLLPLATAAAANPADHELVAAVAAFRVKCGKFYESIATSALKQVRAAAPKEHAASVLLALQREYERLRLLREDPENQDARQVLGVEDDQEDEGDEEGSEDGDRAGARVGRAQRLTDRLAAKLASSFGVARLGGDRHDAVFLLLVNGMRYALGQPPSRLPFLDLLHPFLKLLSPKGKRVLLSTAKEEVQQMDAGPVQRRLVRWLDGSGAEEEEEEGEGDELDEQQQQQQQILAFPAFVGALDPTNKAATNARPAATGGASKRRDRPAAKKRRRRTLGKAGGKAASPAAAKRRRSSHAASVSGRSHSTASKSKAASSMARQRGTRASLDLDNLSDSESEEGGGDVAGDGERDGDSVEASQQSAALAVSQRRRAARRARAAVGTQPVEPETRKRAEPEAEDGGGSDSEVGATACRRYPSCRTHAHLTSAGLARSRGEVTEQAQPPARLAQQLHLAVSVVWPVVVPEKQDHCLPSMLLAVSTACGGVARDPCHLFFSHCVPFAHGANNRLKTGIQNTCSQAGAAAI